MGSIVSGIRNDNHNGIYKAKEWTNGPGSGKDANEARVAAIAAGAPVGEGATVGFNFSPLDAAGKEIGPGDPRHAQVNGGNPYVILDVETNGNVTRLTLADNGGDIGGSGLEIHAMDHDYGCTSNFKVPAGFKGAVAVRARPVLFDGAVEGSWTPTVNVQA